MSTLEEKRVYADKTDRTIVFVAADLGLARVSVVDDRIGEFSLVGRDPTRSVAAAGGRLAVATDEDALVGPSHDDLSPLDFGPAVAVGLSGTRLLVAGEDGRIARAELGDGSPAGFEVLGTLDAGANAIDGDLLATDGGVHRAADGLPHVGLADVNDVAASGTPLAATDDGLYELGNGWMDALEGAFTAASADPDGRRAHAAAADALYARTGEGWADVTPEATADAVADVGYGEGGAVYAVTADGTLLADAGDGWRDRSLGLRGVQELAVSV